MHLTQEFWCWQSVRNHEKRDLDAKLFEVQLDDPALSGPPSLTFFRLISHEPEPVSAGALWAMHLNADVVPEICAARPAL